MPSGPLLGGRYEVHAEIGAGGMASVYLGRLRGAAGFSRVVAIKRMHPHLAKDAEVVAMFLDEARLASRVRHPNVVSIVDVVGSGPEIFLVLEYVPGMALHAVLGAAEDGRQAPPSVALRVLHDALLGLGAAHRATDERGQPLRMVHRDVSPQNLLVGDDGVTRVLDFGIAKAEGRLQERTRTNETKGKLAYMAPEQILGDPLDLRTDVYAAGICLWELLLGRRAFQGADPVVMRRILEETLEPPSRVVPDVTPALDALVARAIAKDRTGRFSSATEMAEHIDALGIMARHEEVRAWLQRRVGPKLSERAALDARIEAGEEVDPAGAPPDPEREPAASISTSTTMSSERIVATRRRAWRPAAIGLAVVAIGAAGAIAWRVTGGPVNQAAVGATVASSAEAAVASASARPTVEPAVSAAASASATPVATPSAPSASSVMPVRPSGVGAKPGASTPTATTSPRRETLY